METTNVWYKSKNGKMKWRVQQMSEHFNYVKLLRFTEKGRVYKNVTLDEFNSNYFPA